MNELKYNGSGAPDPTAYEAIRKISQEEKNRGGMMSFNDGDIVNVEHYSDLKKFLIVRDHGSYVTTIKLTNRRPDSEIYTAEVSFGMGRLYLDASKIGYMMKNKIVSRVFRIEAKEMDQVRDLMAKAMGLRRQPKSVDRRAMQGEKELLIKVAAERDAYKRIVTELITKGGQK